MRYAFAVALATWSRISFGQARPVDDAALRNAAKSSSDGGWLSYGLTPGETRFSPLTLIGASNRRSVSYHQMARTLSNMGDDRATAR